MKRICMLLLLCITLFSLSSCQGKQRDDPLELVGSPTIYGTVEACYADKLALRITDEAYPEILGMQAYVSLNVRIEDSLVRFAPGDDVRVYYNGVMSDGDPVYINAVYTIEKTGK